jgi:LPXTG-site transpeptidase (sortase) family protein
MRIISRKSLYLFFWLAVAGLGIMIAPSRTVAPSAAARQVHAEVDKPVASTPKTSPFTLRVDKLGLKAPILLDVDGRTDAYYRALLHGVAHMLGTAKPTEQGNIVIFGHSSADANDANAYNSIFSKLNNLVQGDMIAIDDSAAGNGLAYKVSGKKIVSPDDTSLIQQNLDTRLTLITCWPIGDDASRLVVWATP